MMEDAKIDNSVEKSGQKNLVLRQQEQVKNEFIEACRYLTGEMDPKIGEILYENSSAADRQAISVFKKPARTFVKTLIKRKKSIFAIERSILMSEQNHDKRLPALVFEWNVYKEEMLFSKNSCGYTFPGEDEEDDEDEDEE